MSLNETPVANRTHIAIFGRRNVGKSSLINAITGQNISLVSDVLGTTTDPVYKTMEILPLGPVVIIDTPGIDDVGELGKMRVSAAKAVLEKTDIAVLVLDNQFGIGSFEKEIIKLLDEKNIPYISVMNKADMIEKRDDNFFYVSSQTGENIALLREKLAQIQPVVEERPLVSDLIKPCDVVLLVTPIDSAAPKGRLILPQQQTIRDILDAGGICIVAKETELVSAINSLSKKPALVICDSQVFKFVNDNIPSDFPLTSFSILFARKKGNLDFAVKSAKSINNLKDGDTVLISEGCTHHRSCEDIGTVKIPNLILKHTKKNILFEFSSGSSFPDDLSKYSLIIHCGGCMLTDKVIKNRAEQAKKAGVAMTNYGTALAFLNGILERSVEPFKFGEI